MSGASQVAGAAPDWPPLVARPLCVADFEVQGGIMALGRSPFSDRRVGYITGGAFRGERLSGEILPGGGNWSHGGPLEPGVQVAAFDARSMWRTHDGALIHLTYAGRSVVPDAVSAAFRDPEAPEVDPEAYSIRIAPVFETADPRYAWLNGVLAVGRGQRMEWGVRHWIYAIA